MSGMAHWPGCHLSRASLLPDRRMPLGGYANRSSCASGEEGTLEANLLLTATADGPLLLIALDTLFASVELRNEIHARLHPVLPDLSAESIQFVASHTHFAPSLDPAKPLLGTCDIDYLERCAMLMAEAVTESLREPPVMLSTIRHGRSSARYSVYRRLHTLVIDPARQGVGRRLCMAPNKDHQIDSDLRLTLLGSEKAEVAAIVWSWPCHAVSSPDMLCQSPSFPGRVRERLRDTFGDQTAVFYLPGFCGDIRPHVSDGRRSLMDRLRSPFAETFAAPNDRDYSELCRELEQAATAALVQARASTADEVDDTARIDRARVPLSDYMANVPSATERVHECVRIRLGSLELELHNAEVCSPYSPGRVADGFYPSGCANAVYGYLPSDRQIRDDGYEVDGFTRYFGLEGHYSDPVEHRLRHLFRR